jgi:hypothetical protein
VEQANLYSNNADVKFPLIDTHQEEIPNDIFTGLSLSVPEGVVPTLTGIRVGIGFVFAVFEDLSTGTAVASVRVDNPQSGLIYPLDMDILGHGFVTFGPGVFSSEGYFSGQVSVTLEPEVVTTLVQQPTKRTMLINGLEYDISNVLEILSATDLLTVSIENGTVYLDRNDAILDDFSRLDLLDRISTASDDDSQLYTLGNIFPDSSGNIDIIIEDCIEECAEVNSLAITRGDLGEGTAVSLPLDVYFPPKPNPDDPCAPSAQGSSSGEPEEDVCVNIYRETINALAHPINIGATRSIGTLYTHIAPGSIPWTPEDLDVALRGWYDASDLTTITDSGGSVSQWNDKSGSGHNLTQATGAEQPIEGTDSIGGLNTITFDGSDDTMSTSSNPFGSSVSNATVFFVLKIKDLSNGTLFSLTGSADGSNRWQAHFPFGGQVYFDCGDVVVPNRINTTSGLSDEQDVIVSFTCESTTNTQEVRINGEVLVSDATGHTVSTVGNIVIGGTGLYQNVAIGECIIINGTFSAIDRQLMEGYLAHKWGLTGSLPTGHPYKLNAP